MDSVVALYWILNLLRCWKVFLANRVGKIAAPTAEVGIKWKYCPTELNLANLESSGGNLDKMEKRGWFEVQDRLLSEDKWPVQLVLKSTQAASDEQKLVAEIVTHVGESNSDEWDELLMRKPYWSTLQVTAGALRFLRNCHTKPKHSVEVNITIWWVSAL